MKNYYEVRGDVTEIYLKRYGLITLIDTADLEMIDSLGDVNWSIRIGREAKWSYAAGTINKKNVTIHGAIAIAPSGMVVDHINHNTLDNRRCNLQIITNAENIMKRSKVRYEWHEKLEEALRLQNERKGIREKTNAEKKIERQIKKENKSKMFIPIPKGIEWDSKNKRFEQTYEYKAV